MSVYLGLHGLVELRRMSDVTQKTSLVNPGDVNVSRRRFSFDFDTGFLNTGDELEITSTNNADLGFIDPTGWLTGVRQPSGSWYINVDDLGGIRLYNTYDKALSGIQSDAIVLTTIAADIPISVRIANAIPHILAQCTYFELSTNREAVDTTALGDEFRSQYSSLISGSGSFRAFWDYLPQSLNNDSTENAHYLLQLAVRTEIGSRFGAKLYLKTSGNGKNAEAIDDLIWYEIEGVISQAAVSFASDSTVEVTTEFVTTGPIRLLSKTSPTDKILQENTDDIRLEQNAAAALLRETG
jgi:hypothetical protein